MASSFDVSRAELQKITRDPYLQSITSASHEIEQEQTTRLFIDDPASSKRSGENWKIGEVGQLLDGPRSCVIVEQVEFTIPV